MLCRTYPPLKAEFGRQRRGPYGGITVLRKGLWFAAQARVRRFPFPGDLLTGCTRQGA